MGTKNRKSNGKLKIKNKEVVDKVGETLEDLNKNKNKQVGNTLDGWF